MPQLNTFSIFLLSTLFLLGYGERPRDKIYENIVGAASCFRKLNGTHQTGCGSGFSGSVGVVHVVNNQSGIDWIFKNGNAGPYIMAISPALFTRSVLFQFKVNHPEKVAGVILLKSEGNRPTYYSHDLQCPNQQFNLAETCSATSWNAIGTELLREDFPFPIFLISESDDIDKMISCFEKFNNFDYVNQRFRSLCALELKAFMFAAVDSETCVRRTNKITNLTPIAYCDPLGDMNIWASLLPLERNYTNIETTNNEIPNKKLIVLTTRLDTTSFFDGVYPGAMNPVSGLVTLLTTAKILKEMNFNNSQGNVLFLILNGETYDYIGSQSILYDMINENFPINKEENTMQFSKISVEDISMFIEIGQISNTNSTNIFHIKYSDIEARTVVTRAAKTIIDNAQLSNISIDLRTNLIPPSSLQTFLRSKDNFPGLVIADHGLKFSDQYYNSIFDDVENLQYKYYNNSATVIPRDSIQAHISDIAFTLAASIYEALVDEYKGERIDKLNLVDELLYCYLISPNCSIFTAASYQQFQADTPMPLYVSVSHWLNDVTINTGATLGLFLGDQVEKSQKNCTNNDPDSIFRYKWVNGDLSGKNTSGMCIQTSMNFSKARSPAFEIEGYDFKSGKYSTWAESTWQTLSVRLFLKPSARHESITISIGVAVMIASFVIVYFINRKSEILFNREANIIGTSC